MQQLKRLFSFTKKPSDNELKHPELAVPVPQLDVKIDNEEPVVPPSEPEEETENIPSLFDRSLKIIFPKNGKIVEHESNLNASLQKLTDIVNVTFILVKTSY
jgi:hypothetical protein